MYTFLRSWAKISQILDFAIHGEGPIPVIPHKSVLHSVVE